MVANVAIRPEHAVAALEKGCHVLVEKPLTTNAADARALVALADRLGRQIVVPYGWNFKPWTEEARQLATRVGRIEHVVLQMANALDDLFAGQPMKETEGAMFRPPASTWADPKRAGGFGWGTGIAQCAAPPRSTSEMSDTRGMPAAVTRPMIRSTSP